VIFSQEGSGYRPSVSDINMAERVKASMILTLMRYFEWKESPVASYLVYYIGDENDNFFKEMVSIAKTKVIWGKGITVIPIKKNEDISGKPQVIVIGKNTTDIAPSILTAVRKKYSMEGTIVVHDGDISSLKDFDIGVVSSSPDLSFQIRSNNIKRKNIVVSSQLAQYKQVKEIE